VITYVDTSSLLKLVVDEDGSEQAELIWESTEVSASAVLVLVEARAALAAAARGARLTAAQHREAKHELAALLDQLTIVEVTENLIGQAAELAETEGLRGYDAVHLAAALAIEANVLTSADRALCDAAQRHGLHVANPLDG
jgi:predicted nucleic acid-binding protein